MDINEKIKPQAGDVWKEEGPAPDFSAYYWTVAAIDNNQVCLYMINDSGNMDLYGTGLAIEDMVEWSEWTLSERDGKPYEPTPQSLEDRIKAEYPEYEVKEIKDNGYGVLSPDGTSAHVLAQSMIGFAGYVYLDNNGEIINGNHQPLIDFGKGYEHPIACLFRARGRVNEPV